MGLLGPCVLLFKFRRRNCPIANLNNFLIIFELFCSDHPKYRLPDQYQFHFHHLNVYTGSLKKRLESGPHRCLLLVFHFATATTVSTETTIHRFFGGVLRLAPTC